MNMAVIKIFVTFKSSTEAAGHIFWDMVNSVMCRDDDTLHFLQDMATTSLC